MNTHSEFQVVPWPKSSSISLPHASLGRFEPTQVMFSWWLDLTRDLPSKPPSHKSSHWLSRIPSLVEKSFHVPGWWCRSLWFSCRTEWLGLDSSLSPEWLDFECILGANDSDLRVPETRLVTRIKWISWSQHCHTLYRYTLCFWNVMLGWCHYKSPRSQLLLVPPSWVCL